MDPRLAGLGASVWVHRWISLSVCRLYATHVRFLHVVSRPGISQEAHNAIYRKSVSMHRWTDFVAKHLIIGYQLGKYYEI